MDHVVSRGDFSLGVGDDGEIHRDGLRLIDVVDPALVRFQRVHAERNHLDVPLFEFPLGPGHGAQFSRAHRRVIGRMREEHAPGIAEPLMEINEPFRGGG